MANPFKKILFRKNHCKNYQFLAQPIRGVSIKGKSGKFAFKLLLVGEPEVGKTSLIKRYVDNFFEEGYQITLGVDFLSKTVILERDEGEQELIYQI